MRSTLLRAVAAAAIAVAPFAAFAQGAGATSADALLDHADRPKAVAEPAPEPAPAPIVAGPAETPPSGAETGFVDLEAPAESARAPAELEAPAAKAGPAPAAKVEPKGEVRRKTAVRAETPPAPAPRAAATRERSVERVSRRDEARVERRSVRERLSRERRPEPTRRLARADAPSPRFMTAPSRRPARVYELPDGRLLVIRPRPERYYRVTVVEEY